MSVEFLTALLAVLMSPLIYVEKIQNLRYVSFVAIFALFSFMVMTIYNSINNMAVNGLPEDITLFNHDFKFW
jgi:amino acid permease